MSFAHTINPKYSYVLTIMNGQERAIPRTDFGALGIRTVIDLVAGWNVNEKLTFTVNYDYGWQTNAVNSDLDLSAVYWQGIAGYATYKISDGWQIALRGEVFNDKNGFITGVRQFWREVTLTLGYSPIKNLLIHLEARKDFSNVNAFTNVNSFIPGVSVAANNNRSYSLEASYKCF